MPKFHIKNEDDLQDAKYIRRRDLIKDEIRFDSKRLKFAGYSYEYNKYTNVLKVCGILENGFPTTVSISKLPIKIYVIKNEIKYKIRSSADYESYYKISEFIRTEVTNRMCLDMGINLKKLYPEQYEKYLANSKGEDLNKYIDLCEHFKTYESKLEVVSFFMKKYLRFNYKIREEFEEEHNISKFKSTPKMYKLLERGHEYYDMHLVYELEFYNYNELDKFYKSVDKSNYFSVLGFKKGSPDKYILSLLSKLDIPINYWVYITNFVYTYEPNGQVNFRLNYDDVTKISNPSDIPLNINNFQVFYDYETYHGGNKSEIISDRTQLCSVSYVYSWLNKPDYGEIFIMNSEKDHITDDNSYTYLCDNEYLTMLCMIRVLYYLQPDYLVAFNAIDFDHIVTMIILRRYSLLSHYYNVLNRLRPVDLNDFDIVKDEEFVEDSNNGGKIYNVSSCYKLDLKERYVDNITHTLDTKLINNKYGRCENIKYEAGKSITFSIINIPGIIFLDVFLICKIKYKKEDFINAGQSLDKMLSNNGFDTKVQLSYYMMWKIFEYIKDNYKIENKKDEETLKEIEYKMNYYMDKWREYNNYDSIACKLILDKLKYIDQMCFEAYSTYIDMYKSCYRAASSKVENLAVGEYFRSGYLVDENEIQNKYGDGISVEGAAVKLEETGLIKKVIQPIDVASLYPSIMICLNLSHDTIQTNDKEIDFILEQEGLREEDITIDLYTNIAIIKDKLAKLKGRFESDSPEYIYDFIRSIIKYQDSKYSIINFNFISDPSRMLPRRMLILNECVRKGIIPKIEGSFFDARVLIKQQLKQYNENDVEYKIIDSRQKAIKDLMNSIYGLLNAPSFILKDEGIANNITLMGRHIILNVKHFCIDVLGLRVGYLDTDSNYLSFNKEVFREQKLAYKSGVITFRDYEIYMVKYTYEKMKLYISIINEFLKYLTKSVHIRMAVEEILYPSYFKGKKNYICKKHHDGVFNPDFKLNGYNYAIKGGNQFKRDGYPILREFISDFIASVFIRCNRKDAIVGELREQIIKYYNRNYTADELKKFVKVQRYNKDTNNISVKKFIKRCADDKAKALEEGNFELYELLPSIEHSDKFQTILVDKVVVDHSGRKIKEFNSVSEKIELLAKATYYGYKPDMISYLCKLSEYLGGFLFPNVTDVTLVKKLTSNEIGMWCGKQDLRTLKQNWKEYSIVYYTNMEKKYPGIYNGIFYINNLNLPKILEVYFKKYKIKSTLKTFGKLSNTRIPHNVISNLSSKLEYNFKELVQNNYDVISSYHTKLNYVFNEYGYERLTLDNLVITLDDNEKNLLIKISEHISKYIMYAMICGLYSDKNL